METQTNTYWKQWINSDEVFNYLIYRNHCALLKKLHEFLGKQGSKSECRRYLSPYLSQNVLQKHNQRCKRQEITSITITKESHLYWKKKQFQMEPFYFGIYAAFNADNEKNFSCKWEKTTNIYKQKPICMFFSYSLWIGWCFTKWFFSISFRIWSKRLVCGWGLNVEKQISLMF